MSEIPTGDWGRIDEAAMRFERAWKDGSRPRIEDYLIEVDEPQRPRLLDELLKVEIELRRGAGEQPDPDEYVERFPAHATVVADVFSGERQPNSRAAGARSSGPANWLAQDLDRSLIRGVLAGLAETSGSVPRILLRDTEPESESPVIRPSSPEIPKESGRYQLLGEIGHGGMGAVLKGRDPDLGRDLAVKILLEEHQRDPELVQRFIEEAQIGGQLQHPGIVPVYELGEFADGRPYFTMKLIKGRTLAALLKERTNPAHDLPRFLAVFDQVCQAMAYAHARGVIHRDLKPSNIMVGSFGEVQVMDWGLAKVLAQGGTADEPLPHPEILDVSVIRTVRSGSDANASRPGSVLGTPAYMAPEQAGGGVELIDERADVFGLGSILCEILTGEPAYAGPSFAAILRKAKKGETADALKRLDACGADGELKALACRCLATDPVERPRDAGVLAAAITAHLSSVQERLRKAELDRVEAHARVEEETKRRILADDLAKEAKARAAEERKRRRMTVALAASILALAALGGGTWLATERSNSERRASVAQVIGEAHRKQNAAREAPADVPALWSEALAAVERAEGLLAQGGEPGQKREIAALRNSITSERDAARNESEWLGQLIDIRSTKAESSDGASPDQSYARVFRAAGIDPDVLGAEEIAARIRKRRPILAQGLVAALDDWAAVRREQRNDMAGAKRLLMAARAADPDPRRERLRVLQEQAGGKERLEALRLLASTAKTDELPAVSLDLLGVALLVDGDAQGAADVLRKAQRSHPRDAWLKYNLARALQKLGRKEEAVRYLMAARTIQPETAHELAHLLESRGESDEAIAVFQDLVRLRPEDGRHWSCYGQLLLQRGFRPAAGAALEKAIAIMNIRINRSSQDSGAYFTLGRCLHAQNKLAEAVEAFRTAVRIRPDFAAAHHELGWALADLGKLDDAIVAYRKARRLKPDSVAGYNNLASVLRELGKPMEAIAEIREAIRLEPDDGRIHDTLGVLLEEGGHFDKAIAEYRQVTRLKPDSASPHIHLARLLQKQGKIDQAHAELKEAVRVEPNNAHAYSALGHFLWLQQKPVEAIAACQEAIRLDPDFALAHNFLGLCLQGQGKLEQAIAEYRDAIRLKPDLAIAHHNLAMSLREQGRLTQAIGEYKSAIQFNRNTRSPDHNPLIDFEARYEIGTIHLFQSEWNKAAAELGEAIRTNPDNAEAHTNLGIALRMQGKRDAAIGQFQRAIALKPDLANAHFGFGDALREQGKLEDATAELKVAARIEPGNASIHHGLGHALWEQKKLAQALAEFRESTRINPDFAEAHKDVGDILTEQRELLEAIGEYKTAIRLNPELVAAHANLAVALGLQGKAKEAMTEYRETIRLEPNFALAHNNLAWALVVPPKRPHSEYDEGLVHAHKAVAHAKNGKNFYGTLALAEYRSGHWAESLAAGKRAMELRKGMFAYDWFFQALAHAQKGDKAEARKWFDKAVAWTKENAPKNAELRQFWSEAAELLGQPGPEASHAP